MRRLYRALSGEISNMHVAAWVLAFFALLSQILGLWRDRLFAGTFGVSLDLDLYNAAFRIPDLLFVILMPLISASVIIPLLHSESDSQKRKEVLDSFWSVFSILLVVGAVIIFFLAPWILSYMFPGYDVSSLNTLTVLTRILLLQPFFLGFSTLLGVAAQFEERFVLPAISPVLYNVGIVIGLIAFLPYGGLTGVVWGVVLGAFLHCIPLLRFAYTNKWMPSFHITSFTVIKGNVSRAWARSAAMFGAQINQLLVARASSFLKQGSLSAFALALNIQSLPVQVIISSYAQASFSKLSKAAQAGDSVSFTSLSRQLVLMTLIWMIPAAIGLYILRVPIVRILYGLNDTFSFDDLYTTAGALAILAVAAVFQALFMILIRFYYAAKTYAVPLIGVACGIVFILLATIFEPLKNLVFTLAEQFALLLSAPYADSIYLALVFTIGSLAALLPVLIHQIPKLKIPLLWIMQIFICGAAMASILLLIQGYIPVDLSSFTSTVYHLLIVGVLGTGVYVSLMYRATLRLLSGNDTL